VESHHEENHQEEEVYSAQLHPHHHKGKLISTEHAKTFELIGAGMAITDATLYRERKYEEELFIALKDLEHLFHLEKYY
jgi:hypothetical protein